MEGEERCDRSVSHEGSTENFGSSYREYSTKGRTQHL